MAETTKTYHWDGNITGLAGRNFILTRDVQQTEGLNLESDRLHSDLLRHMAVGKKNKTNWTNSRGSQAYTQL